MLTPQGHANVVLQLVVALRDALRDAASDGFTVEVVHGPAQPLYERPRLAFAAHELVKLEDLRVRVTRPAETCVAEEIVPDVDATLARLSSEPSESESERFPLTDLYRNGQG
jgi:hypothetical protein